MARQKKSATKEREGMSGIERLSLRVSSMINHPIAQEQRWVTIHRLATDGEKEWEEVMGILSETDGIEMIFSDEEESVTLRWEAASDGDAQVEVLEEFLIVEEGALF